MAVAFAYPEPETGGRGKNSLVTKDFSSTTLSQARTVLRENKQLANLNSPRHLNLPAPI